MRDNTADGAAFGEFLRLARERRGLTLQQISRETKIPFRHLDALEHGLLNAVPGGTYRRGEIRAYAEVVGLDKAVALERLDRALESTAPAPAPAERSTIPLPSRTALVTIIVMAAALAALIWSRDGTPAAQTPSPAASAVGTTPPAPASPDVTPATATEAQPVAPPAPVTATPQPEVAVVKEDAPPLRADVGLTVTSEPPGARVTVDGIAWGSTPLTIAHLPLGERRVRVTLQSFVAAERTVRLTGERPTQAVHVELQRP